ncbi:MAG: ferrous iron transport protein B [Beduini sp.]
MAHLIALVGNQNCGKTTLFNALTGSNQHVGNFPGVTVEKKMGNMKKHSDISIVDLPGIYSLTPYTSEEIVTTDFLIKDQPELILNIIDATNIERNLYLTLQLMELNIPMIIALNMMDEVTKSHNAIDVEGVSKYLGAPVFPISASKNEGIADLISAINTTLHQSKGHYHVDFCKGEIHRAIHSISHLIEDHTARIHYPTRYTVTQLIDGSKELEEKLGLTKEEVHIINHIVEEMEKNLNTDREAAIVDMRYSYIEEICQNCVFKQSETIEQIRSEKIDQLLTHKYLGIPIFIIIMLLIFYLTFTVIGGPLQSILETLIDRFNGFVAVQLEALKVNDLLSSLIVDGILTGVGSVLSFLPIIVILFFFLSLLEDSGYMARVAFVMDKALRKLGLSGRSFVPMLIGFGCSVPAIMATRTLSSERDRKMTIVLTPFLSCSAKLPIYGMIIAAFFKQKAPLVMISVYCIGILVAIISGLILKSTVLKGEPVPFVLELPAYRIPSYKSVLLHMWEKAKDFIRKAFTVIFIASLVIWFLQSFDWNLSLVEDSANSILASIGSLIAPIFKPLGFNDWRASTALITGITAKESVLSTLTVLLNVSNDMQLSNALASIFTPLSAYTFLVFTVLYMPCIAAFAATKKELGSLKEAILTAVFQTLVAYIVAMIVYQLFSLIL